MAAASRSRDRWKSIQNGDLINANFPTYSPSEGDKTSLKAERGPDGVLRATMRGDVFDGRGFLKSAISGKEADPKSKTKNFDFDVDIKLGAVAGSMARRCAASTPRCPAAAASSRILR